MSNRKNELWRAYLEAQAHFESFERLPENLEERWEALNAALAAYNKYMEAGRATSEGRS